MRCFFEKSGFSGVRGVSYGHRSRPHRHQRQHHKFVDVHLSPQQQREDNCATLRLVFHTIPPQQVDMHAESQIESFFRTQHLQEQLSITVDGSTLPVIRVVNVPKSTLKRAVLNFCVRGKEVQALGQSTRAKKARALCCMHAAKLIDHFSLEGADVGAAPLPLEEGVDMTFRGAVSPTLKATAKQPHFSATPPQPVECDQWEKYVNDSEKYIAEEEQRKRHEALMQLRIPPSGNQLVDRAAEITEQETHTDKLASQKLNNELCGATKDVTTTRLSSRVFVSTLVLDSSANLIATGVGETAKEAKQRVAMHALNVIKLVKEQRQSCGTAGEGVGNTTLAGNGSSVSFAAMSLSLTPRYAKMLEFFILLFGVTPNFTFTKEQSSYICHMELDGVKCTGQGINRFEAERSAVEQTLAEMELFDERLHSINSVISQYPNIHPQCVPTAKLPETIRKEIHSFVEYCRTELDLPADDDVNAYGKGGLGDEVGIIDVEARKTINALKEFKCDQNYAMLMRERLYALRANPNYLNRFHFRRTSLAIASVEQRILDAMDRHNVVVVCGTTGCGKTTQVPQYILDREIMAGRGDQCHIVVTQPRRISAFSIADRIASERLDVVGNDVGYAVRLDARPGRHITLCTTGVLLQMISNMPLLDTISHLVIDEVHERDINCDVLLTLVKQLLNGPNKQLKVLLMSATLQSDMFASYFGNAPVISVEGAVYPVQERYLDDVAQLFNYPSLHQYYSPMFDSLDDMTRANNSLRSSNGQFFAKKRRLMVPLKTDYTLLARLIERSVVVDLNNNTTGKSILVFLPGWKEIVAAKRALEACRSEHCYHIILLHSSVEAAKQRECFAPAPKGYVKVILATNIAESGITIDDAAVVIDTGLIKQTSWVFSGNSNSNDINNNHASSYSTQLALQYASRANCTQRKGRAGRTQGGVCYRLFTREVWEMLPLFQEAEIHRVPLTQVLLTLLSLGHNKPKETLRTFIEPPSENNVDASMRQLQSLGAVTKDEKLTPLGLYLSRLPCDPRIGKMIMMGAVLRCLDSALTMAATADISPFLVSREVSCEVRQRRHVLAMKSQSDHVSVLNAYNAYCARSGDSYFAQENYLHQGNMWLISKYKEQYRDILRRSGFICDKEQGNYFESFDDEFGEQENYFAKFYVDCGPLSQDAADVALVKACLCAALFPNVAVLDPVPLLHGGKKKKTLVMRTATYASISPSKDSACRRLVPPRSHGVLSLREFFGTTNGDDHNIPVTPSMLYMYQNIFGVKDSREEFLTQVSSVSLWALLLFGVGDADIHFDALLGLCVVSGWIGIHIDVNSFAALRALRSTLHACVWRKYKEPNDEKNNRALEVLRRLCKAILHSPPNDKEHNINLLVDTGRILSPTQMESLEKASVSDDILED